jgi:hypothetical protein
MKKLQLVTFRLALVLAVIAGLSLMVFQAVADDAQAPAAATASTADSAALETVPPAQPMALVPSTCEPMGTTDTEWGMGSDCTAAAGNLNVNLLIDGREKCADLGYLPCGITNTVIVTACHLYQGSYRTDGYATFKCRIPL